MTLHRYWFEFETADQRLAWGCGVTALDRDDAIRLISDGILKGGPVPVIKKVVEDVDVSTLDEGHVRPNMGPPNLRGVWFPLGVDW